MSALEMKSAVFATLLCAALTACSSARTPQQYGTDTRALLETKSGPIKACYDDELKRDAKAKGTVVVKFGVEPETGKITGAAIDGASTASKPLGECVMKAVEGLVLTPPDPNAGQASFSWEFTISPQPALAPAEPPPPSKPPS